MDAEVAQTYKVGNLLEIARNLRAGTGHLGKLAWNRLLNFS